MGSGPSATVDAGMGESDGLGGSGGVPVAGGGGRADCLVTLVGASGGDIWLTGEGDVLASEGASL